MSSILIHVILAVVTLAVIIFAGVYALLLTVQDYSLRQHHAAAWLKMLPPLERSEKRLFQLTIAGFILLSVLAISGFYCFHQLLMSSPWLLQKTILVGLAWWVFAVVLWGRWQFGWRGRAVTYSLLGGMLLLLMIYIISRIAIG